MKDVLSRRLIARCNISGPLYPLRLPVAHSLVATTESTLWHRRLGHPGHDTLSQLASSGLSACHHDTSSSLYHASQLGRHVCLPFPVSSSRATNNFDIINLIYGHPLFLVFLVSNIIWLFLMTAHITYGRFP